MTNSYEIPYWIFIAVGAGVGLLCGLVPLILGFMKKKVRLGLIGFVACILIGTVLSLLGGIPTAAIFAYLITKRNSDVAPLQ